MLTCCANSTMQRFVFVLGCENSFHFSRNVSGGVCKPKCALKACTHQTGIMVPLHVGRRIKHSARTNYRGSVVSVYDGAASSPQEKIEKWLRKCPKCFIVCSTNCLRHVNAAIHGLGGLWRDVQVVRGTHPIPATLERRYLAGSRRIFEGVPGQFDALIDEFDVITPERRT